MSTQNSQGMRRIWLALLPVVIYAAVLPYVIFRLTSLHMPTASALLLSAIPPALGSAIELIRARRLNLLSTLVLVGIVIRIISALVFKDVRLIQISDSLMIGVWGIMALVSLAVGKPLLLVLARNLLGTIPLAEREQWEKRWQDAGRFYFTFITALWGTGLTMVLIISVLLTYLLTVQQFVAVSAIVQYGTFGALILLSQVYGIIRRARRPQLPERSQQQR